MLLARLGLHHPGPPGPKSHVPEAKVRIAHVNRSIGIDYSRVPEVALVLGEGLRIARDEDLPGGLRLAALLRFDSPRKLRRFGPREGIAVAVAAELDRDESGVARDGERQKGQKG